MRGAFIYSHTCALGRGQCRGRIIRSFAGIDGEIMDREILFANTLEEVRKKAREQGNCISKEQVREAFAALSLEEEQLQLVYDYLEKHKIGIGEPVDLDEYLTEEENDYLLEYMDSLQGLPELSAGEKEAAFLSAMAGEREAQRKLLEAFLSQVPEIAKLYTGQGVFLEDLIGQGNMALSEGVRMLGAAENAKDAEGMLVRMLMDSMEELIGEGLKSTDIDRKLEKRVNDIAEKARELAEELRRKVTPKELSEETGIFEEEIRAIYRMSGYAIEDIEDK